MSPSFLSGGWAVPEWKQNELLRQQEREQNAPLLRFPIDEIAPFLVAFFHSAKRHGIHLPPFHKMIATCGVGTLSKPPAWSLVWIGM